MFMYWGFTNRQKRTFSVGCYPLPLPLRRETETNMCVYLFYVKLTRYTNFCSSGECVLLLNWVPSCPQRVGCRFTLP